MKVYDVYYVVKMNSKQYVYCLAVEAKNAVEAKKKVVGIVYRETGRNAFTPSTKKTVDSADQYHSRHPAEENQLTKQGEKAMMYKQLQRIEFVKAGSTAELEEAVLTSIIDWTRNDNDYCAEPAGTLFVDNDGLVQPLALYKWVEA